MKILYLHQHFSTPKGAVGIRSYQMARKCIANGHQVLMVCGSYGNGHTGLDTPFYDGFRRGYVDGIEVIEFDLSYSNSTPFLKRIIVFLKFMNRAIKIALTEKVDLIFATTTPLTVAIPGIVAKWLRDIPFVFEVRDLWPEIPRAMKVIRSPIVLFALSVLEWASYKSADRLIALSPGIKEGIARRGIKEDRIAMIPNGCDIDIFEKTPSGRRQESKKSRDFIAIFAGTHGLANGLFAVLDAAIELKARRRNDIKILLVGSGMQKQELINRAVNEKLENVIFLDPVDKKKLALLLKNSDLGLQILSNVPEFYFGTSPNKFFDYIAAGLPVLTNYPGWIANLVVDNSCGFAVPPDSASEFADTLESAADDRARLADMSQNALKLAKRQFNRDVLGDLWLNWVANGVASGHHSAGN